MKSLAVFRILIVVLFVSCIHHSPVGAQSKRYSITYNSFVSTRQPFSGDDSLKIIHNGKTTIAPLSLPDSISVVRSLLTCVVEGDKDSSVLKHISNDAKDPKLGPRIVLTMFYRNGTWYGDDEGTLIELLTQKSNYETTNEKKMIFGYMSTKVMVTNAYDTLEAWIATALPNTLTPSAGYRSSNGAILELHSTKTSVKFIAREVVAKN